MKAAIFKAMVLLPSRRDELIRTQAAIRAGELKRINALIEENLQMARELEERRVSAAGDEADFLSGKSAEGAVQAFSRGICGLCNRAVSHVVNTT